VRLIIFNGASTVILRSFYQKRTVYRERCRQTDVLELGGQAGYPEDGLEDGGPGTHHGPLQRHARVAAHLPDTMSTTFEREPISTTD
jgi:hypothetical protein